MFLSHSILHDTSNKGLYTFKLIKDSIDGFVI